MQGEWDKNSYEYQFMGDFYKLCKEFYLPDGNNEYWQKLVNASCALSKKYGNTEFVLNLVLGFVNYAETEFKKKQYGVEKSSNLRVLEELEKVVNEKG